MKTSIIVVDCGTIASPVAFETVRSSGKTSGEQRADDHWINAAGIPVRSVGRSPKVESAGKRRPCLSDWMTILSFLASIDSGHVQPWVGVVTDVVRVVTLAAVLWVLWYPLLSGEGYVAFYWRMRVAWEIRFSPRAATALNNWVYQAAPGERVSS